MSVDTIRVGTEPSRRSPQGFVDVTGVPVSDLADLVEGTGGSAPTDVHLQRVRGRTYLVTHPDE